MGEKSAIMEKKRCSAAKIQKIVSQKDGIYPSEELTKNERREGKQSWFAMQKNPRHGKTWCENAQTLGGLYGRITKKVNLHKSRSLRQKNQREEEKESSH